jgi:membrane protein YdbS with pleckstrin-like domain
MLTEQENEFVRYWEENRLRKKRVMQQLYVGLPFAVFLVLAIFINIFSGWYQRAATALSLDRGTGLMILVSVFAIVIFIVIFAARHRWDMNEQRYLELLAKRDRP